MGPFRDELDKDGFQRINEMLMDVVERVHAYYGFLELRAASPELARLEEQLEMPEELILADTLLALNAPLIEGGYLQQPWLLTQIIETAVTARIQYTGRAEAKR